MSQISDKKAEISNKVQGLVQAEASGVKARVTNALRAHPKTFVVFAFIAGFVLGAALAVDAGHLPVQTSAGATAPHESYAATPRSEWHEFVPFNDGGAAGRG